MGNHPLARFSLLVYFVSVLILVGLCGVIFVGIYHCVCYLCEIRLQFVLVIPSHACVVQTHALLFVFRLGSLLRTRSAESADLPVSPPGRTHVHGFVIASLCGWRA
ncbi:hypothetical protein EDB85DRAFT_1285889 [Lactarius pseudohatsudake]|nr:hypothetical protein EDB85DRAFT_1285889 [Lactarius pseudohatsudake]